MAKTKGLYKRGNIWWLRYAGPDGRTRYESSRTSSYRDAQDILINRKKEVQEGKDPTLVRKIKHHLFDELAGHYETWSGRQRSFKSKQGFIKQLKKAFGGLPLRSFTTRGLEEYQTKALSEDKAHSTINRHIATLKHMFTKAVEWEMVEEEVLKKVRRVKLLPENNRRLRYLSREECRALMDACADHLKPVVVTALNTGMRKEEILSLEWDRNIDLKHGFILLEKTKNGERREIPINNTLRETLQGLVRHIKSPYVFTDRAGNRFRDLKKSFAVALRDATLDQCPDCSFEAQKGEAAEPGQCPECGTGMERREGIRDFRFHDLRHTFASHLVMAGVDITTVKELLGHKTLAMTLRYAHLAPAHKARAVEILDKNLGLNSTIQKLYNFKKKGLRQKP
ncbi:MAG: tyrosine-type recombinase/integrase [Thermodesulfobacteriota bacterium]